MAADERRGTLIKNHSAYRRSSPETSSQLIDSSSEHCGIGLRPVHPSAARTALVGRASACQSERSSDSTSSAPPLAPGAPGFPTHSTTTPSWHELCVHRRPSAFSPLFTPSLHPFHAI